MFRFFKYQLWMYVLFFSFNYSYGSDKNRTKVSSEECVNYVLIQGSSNINHFEFVNYSPKITEPTAKSIKKEIPQDIQIPVKQFSGENNRMLSDFFELLKASKYPFIKIEIEPRNKADFDESTGLTNFKTKISIAGNTRIFIIPCQINFCEDSEPIIEGNIEIELSDFDIEPPKRLLGTVKVNDEVFITFAFRYNLS